MTKISKRILSTLLIIICVLFVTNVHAEPADEKETTKVCSDERASLLREALNVKANILPHIEICYPGDECHKEDLKNYIGEDGEMHGDLPVDEEGNYIPYVNASYLEIDIYNISENLKAKLEYSKDTIYDYPKEIEYKEGVNKHSFKWEDLEEVGTFTISIYGSDKTACSGEVLREISLKHPKENKYYQFSMCEGLEDYYLCQPFVSFDIEHLNAAKVWQKIEAEKNTRDEEKNKDIKKDDKDNKLYMYIFAATAGGVGLVVLGIVLIKKKRR